MPSVFSINPQQIYHHEAHHTQTADILPLRTEPLSYRAMKRALLEGPLRLGITQRLLACLFIGAAPHIRSLIDKVCKNDRDMRARTLKRRIHAFMALRQMARRGHEERFEITALLHEPVDGRISLCYYFCIDGHELLCQHFVPETTEQALTLLAALPHPRTVTGEVRERLLDTRDNLLLASLSVAFAGANAKSPLMAAQPADLTPDARAQRLYKVADAFHNLNRHSDFLYGYGGLLFRKIALLQEALRGDPLISTLEMDFAGRHALILRCGAPPYEVYYETIDDESRCFEDFAVVAATMALNAETVWQRVTPSKHHEIFLRAIQTMSEGDLQRKTWIRTHLQSELFGHPRFSKFTDHDDGTFTAIFGTTRQRFSNKQRGPHFLSGETLKYALTMQFATLEQIISAHYHAELLDDAKHIVHRIQEKISAYGLLPTEEESVYAKMRFLPVLAYFFDDLRQR